MRVILLGDIHLSARNDSKIVMEHQISFFTEQLFPYMLEHNLYVIVTCGDVFDRRKYTSHITLHQWKERVFDYMLDNGITLITLVGNHDCPWANTLTPNTIELTLAEYDNIQIYNKPTEIMLGNTRALMVPWICRENKELTTKMIQESKSRLCFGHFDIIGFEMYRGQLSQDGLDPAELIKFESVISGHYHTRSTKNNIHYLGTPYEMTWIDAEDPKGFYDFDTDSLDSIFIQNTKCLFQKIYWDDKGKNTDYWKLFDIEYLKGSYVKLFVINKTDPYQFSKFLDRLELLGLADLKIVEDFSEFAADAVDDEGLAVEDTLSLMDTYVDALDTELDLEKIKIMLRTLYTESLSVEI